MNIADVVGTKVMVLFHTTKGLGQLGIDAESLYCKVVGYDNIGVWIENPHYEETPIRNANGDLIPPEERERASYTAHILIPWGNVRSIAHFPGREKEALESEEVRPLGSYL